MLGNSLVLPREAILEVDFSWFDFCIELLGITVKPQLAGAAGLDLAD